jgi:hypothetical protein
MTEQEQIRFLDAGRLQLGFLPLTQSDSYDAIASKKFKLSDHGNVHGISVFASNKGNQSIFRFAVKYADNKNFNTRICGDSLR